MLSVVTQSSLSVSKRSALLGLLLLAPAPTLGVWFAAFASESQSGAILWGLAKLWLLVGPVVWWRVIQQQPLALPRPTGLALKWGVLTGALMAGIIFAAYWFIARPVLDFSALNELMARFSLDSVHRFLLLVTYLTLVNSLIEEYVFRWFMQTQLSRLVPALMAVAASAGLFTLHHTVVLAAYIPFSFNLLASLGIFTGALIWSWLYYRTGNLWTAYISHIGADIGVFAVGFHILFISSP